MTRFFNKALFGTVLVSWLSASFVPAQPESGTFRLAVDATEAPRKILHARLEIPVSPGPLTLVYPEWIPGEHMPSGPIINLAGLRFSAGGKDLAWRRDLVDMYAFQLQIPAGASSLDVALDYLPVAADTRFSSGSSTSEAVAVVNWNQLVLYPKGARPPALECRASLRLPAQWRFATALPVEKTSGDEVDFAPASLETLVDSPVLLGRHFRKIDLSPGQTPPHEVDMAADSEAALEMPEDWIAALQQLVRETGALFGSRHYRDYHFLFTLSDHVASFGLEHHESSDDRVPERTLLDSDGRLRHAGLLPHEFVHSWNGKYRRPADLTTPDYQEPMRDDLLWVYEGLTQYLGDILTARSGLWSPDQFREELARVAARLDHWPGRTWRPLSDTAVAAQHLYAAPDAWASWRRETDFYDESALIWLEADATIRRETKGRRSLDDFCRAFHGGPGGRPEVRTYVFDDVVAGLSAVAPHDWKAFLTERLQSLAPHAPLAGLEQSGWRLVYDDKPNTDMKAREELDDGIDLSYSLGMEVDREGVLTDVIPGMPAARAGLSPGLKVVAVDGRSWSRKRFLEALAASRSGSRPIEILAVNGDFYRTFSVEDHGGMKYPHLERIPGVPDLLDKIIEPRSRRPS
jgi:predicted metalloprotease with PDZ domain